MLAVSPNVATFSKISFAARRREQNRRGRQINPTHTKQN